MGLEGPSLSIQRERFTGGRVWRELEVKSESVTLTLINLKSVTLTLINLKSVTLTLINFKSVTLTLINLKTYLLEGLRS